MKTALKKHAADIIVSSVIFYIFSIFLSFDNYCKTQVTPETPLFNIAGLPFLRMEFISIIFAFAFIIGTLIIVLFKKADKFFLPFALGFTGILTVFISLFDVNTLQLFAPKMRISHVIMTVSQVLAIVAAVSGGFIGAACAVISRQKISSKAVLPSSLSAAVLSILANEENLQGGLFFISGILLLLGSIVSDFGFEYKPAAKIKMDIKREILPFILTVSFTALFGILYASVYENAGFSLTGFTAVSGILIILFALSIKMDYNVFMQPAAIFIGTIISFVLVHFAGNVITYSGNRVIYVIPYSILLILSAVCAGLFIAVFASKKSKGNKDEKPNKNVFVKRQNNSAVNKKVFKENRQKRRLSEQFAQI